MILITQDSVKKFRGICDAYLADVQKIPLPGSWKEKTDDDVWIRSISQVVVVGRSEPAERLKDKPIRSRLNWSRISSMTIESAQTEIWDLLRNEIKARYAGKQVETCVKTKAIMKNRKCFMEFPGGPTAFLEKVAFMEGGDQNKIDFVSANLGHIKNKGARDFLMSGFGIVRNSIAIDVRVRKALGHIGIEIDEKKLTDKIYYADVEQALLVHLCGPLQIEGADLDQLLYSKYDIILGTEW